MLSPVVVATIGGRCPPTPRKITATKGMRVAKESSTCNLSFPENEARKFLEATFPTHVRIYAVNRLPKGIPLKFSVVFERPRNVQLSKTH